MRIPEELQFMFNTRKEQKRTQARMDGKLCVITGATSGVGYETAKCLANAGANLCIVCRNPQKAENVKIELEGQFRIKVEIVIADFSNLSDVRGAADQILKQFPKIDVLINNAGVHQTKRVLNDEGIEMAFAVNHLASFLLTRLLIDRLKESAPSRIIQVNSQGHRFGGLDIDDINWDDRKYSGLRGYGASKVAQLLTVWRMADDLDGTGITINAVHPGEVRTNIGMNNGWFYRVYQKHFLSLLLKDPKTSGEAIYYLAAAPEMAEVSGVFFNQTIPEKPAAYAHALDWDMSKKIWKLSEELTGLS